MKNSILIVGSSGFLGSHLLQAGALMGGQVFGITRSNKDLSINEAQLDWLDTKKLNDYVEKLNPTVIVNCVALTSLELCESDPVLSQQLNVTLAQNIATMARNFDTRFVQISTDAVFDGERGCYTEDDTPSPINTYGRQKLAAERTALRSEGQALVIRTNFFGFSSGRKDSFLDVAESDLRKGHQTPGFIDAFVSFLSVLEVAPLILKLADSEATGLMHLCGSMKVSKFEFLKYFATLAGYPPELVIPTSTNQVLREPRGRDLSLTSIRSEEIIGKTPNPFQSLETYLIQTGRLK